MNLYKNFLLVGDKSDADFPALLNVNGHIHTPHSFSAFNDFSQIFSMAVSENISVLGINDFYTTDGYGEFVASAMENKVFPLFNIEFMALQKAEQQADIRVNDPQNPGRTYLSGKGLRFPTSMSEASRKKLEQLKYESNRQTYEMVDKLNDFLKTTSIDIHFNAAEMQTHLAKNLLRERHIAKAVRMAVSEKFQTPEKIKRALTEIFSGKEPQSPPCNAAALENEIRNNLLKVGGVAYVAEDGKAFLSLEEVVSLIVDAGGIPCYPALLDDAKGNLTDFEKNYAKMCDTLKSKNIFAIELIPGRNSFHALKEFVRFFDGAGFVVTFGTEHNTPQLDPLTVSCRGGVPLDEELLQINYKGVAVIAAHQYRIQVGEKGFPANHMPAADELKALEILGKQVIANFIK
ncbi:MAG: hypothetical protein FWG22_01245 [Prolixibacteraceae bacterium]|nr:hypothetical protein [Prolixibacteraceae bacterium]